MRKNVDIRRNNGNADAHKFSHLAILVHAILRAMGLRFGIFLPLVVGGEAIVVVGKVIHRLLILEEGGQGLAVSVIVRGLAIAERSVEIIQIKVGDSSGIGGALNSSTGSVTNTSSVISGVGSCSTSGGVLPTALPTTKVASAVVSAGPSARIRRSIDER